MRYRFFVLAVCVALLSSCGDPDPEKSVLISVDVAQQLETVVTVTEVRGLRPGETHFVETAITVRNNSNIEQRMTAKGIWRDTRSTEYGGFEIPLVLPPNGSETVRQNTDTKKVTILNFFLRPVKP